MEKRKVRLLALIGALSLSLSAMATATLAWFSITSTAADKIKLVSGESSVVVDCFAYAQDYITDTSGNPVAVAYNKSVGSSLLNATKSSASDSEGAIAIDFSSGDLSSFSFASLYQDEESLNPNLFPHLYLEMRYTKDALDGYVKLTMQDVAYASDETGYTNISSSLDFQYRYLTEQNSNTMSYTNGFRAALADSSYSSNAWNTLASNTSSLSLYNNTTDLSGSTTAGTGTLSPQCYVPGFGEKDTSTGDYYYSKSTLLEIRVTPASLLTYILNHPEQGTNALSSGSSAEGQKLWNFGMKFTLRVDFSNFAYYESEQK